MRTVLLTLLTLSSLAHAREVSIPDKWRFCASAANCMPVETLCNACCGLDAVAKKYEAAFAAAYAKTCANFQGGVCDCMPIPGKIMCVEKQCRRVSTPPPK